MQGVLNITEAEYHANAFDDRPALSSSIIHILCDQSPLHAWHAHPKLNPNWRPADSSKQQELGTLVHALVLQGIDRAEVLDFADYRTKAAKEARDEARAAGKIPILADKFYDVQQMVKACKAQLATHKDAHDAFTAGQPEQTVIWEEDGILFKARMDWLQDSYRKIDDYKTTSGTANPEVFSKNLFAFGQDIQAALYRKAVKTCFGVAARFRFIVQETSAPYAISVVTPSDEVLCLAEKKIALAGEMWLKCLASGVWPGYEPRTLVAPLPAWEDRRWTEKELLSLGLTA